MTDIQHHDFAPASYHSVTPFFVVEGGSAALDFYQRAFGARVLSRMDGENGTVLHAEIMIGDSVMQMSDPLPSMGIVAPGDTRTGSFCLYVPDIDATYAAAIEAGATAWSGIEDVFSGDRMGVVLCPFGHRWVIMTRVEQVSNEEIERRAREWLDAGAEHAEA